MPMCVTQPRRVELSALSPAGPLAIGPRSGHPVTTPQSAGREPLGGGGLSVGALIFATPERASRLLRFASPAVRTAAAHNSGSLAAQLIASRTATGSCPIGSEYDPPRPACDSCLRRSAAAPSCPRHAEPARCGRHCRERTQSSRCAASRRRLTKPRLLHPEDRRPHPAETDDRVIVAEQDGAGVTEQQTRGSCGWATTLPDW